MSENNYEDIDAIALWKRVSKTGTAYLGGVIEVGEKKYKVRAFPVKEKKNTDSPDYFFRKRNVDGNENKQPWQE